jgi:AcrR family transcriptional regulator
MNSKPAQSQPQMRLAVADKREAILYTATRGFAESGYFNSKVANIARAAGVADGTRLSLLQEQGGHRWALTGRRCER